MCTNPSDLLDTAKRFANLKNLTESDCRAIVSRSYYAALHGVNCCFPEKTSRSGAGSHEEIIGKADRHGKSLMSGRTEANSVARNFRMFKKLRKMADYEMDIDFDPNEVNNSIALCTSILDHCNIIREKLNTPAI